MSSQSKRTMGAGSSQTQQRGLIAVALAGCVALALVNRAVSSNVEKPGSEATPTPLPTATASASASATEASKPKMPKPYQRYANNPELASRRLTEIARETKGDWNKVSWDDQVFINRMTQGHGPEMLRRIARESAVLKPVSRSTSAP